MSAQTAGTIRPTRAAVASPGPFAALLLGPVPLP
jgi:hypothetical protein